MYDKEVGMIPIYPPRHLRNSSSQQRLLFLLFVSFLLEDALRVFLGARSACPSHSMPAPFFAPREAYYISLRCPQRLRPSARV
jgi:hypothetical protein